MDRTARVVDLLFMRIKLELGQQAAKEPPAFMTVDELPDVGETLRTENSDIYEIMKIVKTPDTKEQNAIVVVKEGVSGAVPTQAISDRP